MGHSPAIRAVVFDLDDVVRHYGSYVEIEDAHRIPRGQLSAAAFEPDLIDPVITGRYTYEEWMNRLEARLVDRFGAIAGAAAAAFGALRAEPDPAMVALVDALRGQYTAGLLTNGTTRVEQELAECGLDAHFDHVWNSARLGVAKPDPAVFRIVLDDLSLPADVCVHRRQRGQAGRRAPGRHALHSLHRHRRARQRAPRARRAVVTPTRRAYDSSR